VTTAPKRQPIPFGKYLLLDRVNIGGMAEVWRAKSFGAGGFERLVAIKRILPNIAEDAEFIEMFIDEAKITVQLNHANIAQIYELSSLANSYFIAMEYVSGKDMRALFDRCRKKGEPPPIPLTCFLLAQCCEGLDYAHRASDNSGRPMNIVHRDVSPQNALISYEGEVKIIDFGIAKAAGKASKTQHGILKGKFGYMSPEQIRGLPLDRRSDVFALGICLYEMLTCERLFVGDSDFSVLEKVRTVEIFPPSHFNRRIPDVLEKIVMKALAKDAEDRHSHASDLAEDLRRFLYTSGFSFTRKDLAAYMKATFAEDVEKERQRLLEYGEIKAPEGLGLAGEREYGSDSQPEMREQASDVNLVPTPMMTPVSGPTAQLQQPPEVVARPSAPRSAPPRLSAAAPASPQGKAEHEVTILAEESKTEGAARPASPRDLLQTATNPGWSQPEPKTNPLAPERGSPELSATNVVPPFRPSSDRDETGEQNVLAEGAETGPIVMPHVGATSGPIALPSGTSPALRIESTSMGALWTIIGGGVIVIATIIGMAFALRPAPRGLLILDLPESVTGKARVNLNGKDLTEADGSPLKDWPQIREVNAGKNTVMIVVPGYETLTETVEVKEGNEYTPLKSKLKKKTE
jgi:serine/threonine protein kinase